MKESDITDSMRRAMNRKGTISADTPCMLCGQWFAQHTYSDKLCADLSGNRFVPDPASERKPALREPNAKEIRQIQDAANLVLKEISCLTERPRKALGELAGMSPEKPKRKLTGPTLSITILGQVRGGKNNMIVTRTGKRFPKASWAKWRDDAVNQVWNQISAIAKITEPCNVRLEYVSGDRRRRDMPAVIDAVWHVLEKAGVVSDDTLLWAVESSRSYDKANPRVTITFL